MGCRRLPSLVPACGGANRVPPVGGGTVKHVSPDKYRIRGATHQLFALDWYRKHNGTTPDLDRLIRRISVRIRSEASIDFRVTNRLSAGSRPGGPGQAPLG